MHLLSLGAPYNQIYHFIQIEHFVKKNKQTKNHQETLWAWVSSEIFDNNADTPLELTKMALLFFYLTVRKINMFFDKLIFVYESKKVYFGCFT